MSAFQLHTQKLFWVEGEGWGKKKKKKIKGGLTLLLFILQTAWAECFHNWVNTPRKYETDYACHKHATKMHKIPHDTCKCRLRRLSSGPLDSDSEWVEDQTYDITKYLWGEGRKIIFFSFVFNHSSTFLCPNVSSSISLRRQGAMFPFPLPVWIAAYIFTGRLLYRGLCLEKDPPICKSKPMAVACTISAS